MIIILLRPVSGDIHIASLIYPFDNLTEYVGGSDDSP